VGPQHLDGQVGERSGSMVVETGKGELCAPLGGQPSLTLNYRFD
jgi:hypothetical protein